jgi:DNA-binding transcriptional ArsR family regulator
MSAIPGGVLPDGLLNALKALADPTRLKILRYIAQGPHTPSKLAKRLRLRAPTVTHHLNELRLAGLVNMTMDGQEKKYTARFEALQGIFTTLQEFLKMPEEKV